MSYAQLTKAQVKEIYDIACDQWKQIIKRKAGEDPFSDKVYYTEQEVEAMFNAASAGQKKILKSLFPEHNKSSNIETLKDVSNILSSKFTDRELEVRNDKTERAQFALAKLVNIADAYNSSRGVVDWKNTNQTKYFSYYDFDFSRLFYYGYNCIAYFPAGVVFLNADDLKDAQSKFEQIFLDYHMI